MIAKSTLDFLKKLKKNNDKVWMDANQAAYKAAKDNFGVLVQHLIHQLAKIDKRYGELQVKDCVFRINRDIRFSKDKAPYKTNMGAAFVIGGKKSNYGGFYVHIEPNKHFIGGGMWMPQAEALTKIRQEIDYNFKEFRKIITEKQFVKSFKELSQTDKLVNPPKGYDKANPAIEFLRLKSYTVSEPVSELQVLDAAFAEQVFCTFKVMSPLIAFLNKSVD